MVVEGGRSVGQTTPENARRAVSPSSISRTTGCRTFLGDSPGSRSRCGPIWSTLPTDGSGPAKNYARAREDRFFEAFGIFPSLNRVRRRIADRKRHACHERVKDAVLEELSARSVIPAEELEKIPNPDPATVAETPKITTGRTISPRPLTALEKRAVVAMQAHLRCEDLLSRKANAGRMDHADGRRPEDLPAAADDRGQRERRSPHPHGAPRRQPRAGLPGAAARATRAGHRRDRAARRRLGPGCPGRGAGPRARQRRIPSAARVSGLRAAGGPAHSSPPPPPDGQDHPHRI